MNATIKVTVSMLAAIVLFGCATTAQKPATTAAVNNPHCLTETGSNIASSDKSKCVAFGRSYSSEDISRTGSTTAGGALRLLDPALTVH